MDNKKLNVYRASILPIAIILVFSINMFSSITPVDAQNFNETSIEETKASVPIKEETITETTAETTIRSSETTEDEEPDETEENNYEIDNNLHISPTPTKKRKPNIMKLSEKQMKKLSLADKAAAVGISVKSFKNFTSVINHEAGTQMEDKILVAAVIWNRVRCEKFPNSVNKVINQSGQFYDISKDKSGSYKDKKAQLAILIAYKRLKKKQIPHNLLFFNSISYNTKNKKRYKPYKHYGNYFLKDSYCWCDWCKKTQRKGM